MSVEFVPLTTGHGEGYSGLVCADCGWLIRDAIQPGREKEATALAAHSAHGRCASAPVPAASGGAAMSAPISYAPGYLRGPVGGEYVRLLNPYQGETFSTLDEAKVWVAEEEHDKYMSIIYFEVRPLAAAAVSGEQAQPRRGNDGHGLNAVCILDGCDADHGPVQA